MLHLSRVLSLLLVPAGLLAQVVPVIASRFDSGTTEGWTATSTAAFSGSPTGGNPGGYLYVDNSEVLVCYLIAPAEFRGDLRSYVGGSLSFDGFMIGRGGIYWNSPENYGHVWLSNGSLQMVVDLEPGMPSTTGYRSYSVPLLAADWGVPQPTFDAVISHVTELRISVEALYGAEVHAIDNIVIAPCPAPATAQSLGPACTGPGSSSLLRAMTLPWVDTVMLTEGSGLPYPGIVIVVTSLQGLPPGLVPLTWVFAIAEPGCDARVWPDILLSGVTTTGVFQAGLYLSNSPSLVGVSFFQQMVAIWVDPLDSSWDTAVATNPLQLTAGTF